MIALLAVPFAVIFSAAFLLMFTHTSSAHSGASVDQKSAGGFWGAYLGYLTSNPLTKAISAGIHWVIGNARGWVSHWALAAAKPLAGWFDGLTELNQRTAAEHSALAVDTADGFAGMRYGVIPRALARALHQPRLDIKTASRTADIAAARTAHLSEVFTTTHRAQVRRNVHYSHAIDIALPRDIARIRAAEEKLSRDQAELRERTTSLENGALKTFEWIKANPLSLATGVFAGAIAVALGRLGFNLFRCRGWQGLGRRLTCGMGTLLEDLLFGIIDVLIVADLCRITQLMIQAAESGLVQDALGSFVHGLDDLLLCQGVKLAPTLDGYWTALPPSQAFSALPAV